MKPLLDQLSPNTTHILDGSYCDQSLPEPLVTPITYLENVGYAKIENLQITGSVKYRMVYHRLKQAISNGDISSNTCLMEASAGSTGIALAFAGQQLGLPVEISVFDGENPKYKKIESLGAKLKKWPKGTDMSTILLYIKCCEKHKQYWHLNQFNREYLNAAYQNLSHEIIEQLSEIKFIPENFLCPVGTGGVIQGIGERLIEKWPQLKIFAFEPDLNIHLDGMRNADQIYLGEDDPYDKNFPYKRFFLNPTKQKLLVNSSRLGTTAQLIASKAIQEHLKLSLLLAVD